MMSGKKYRRKRDKKWKKMMREKGIIPLPGINCSSHYLDQSMVRQGKVTPVIIKEIAELIKEAKVEIKKDRKGRWRLTFLETGEKIIVDKKMKEAITYMN